jgi:hypothetical protein
MVKSMEKRRVDREGAKVAKGRGVGEEEDEFRRTEARVSEEKKKRKRRSTKSQILNSK